MQLKRKSAIALLVLLGIALIIYFLLKKSYILPSCGYSKHYSSDNNRCQGVIEDCDWWGTCAGPVYQLNPGSTINICKKEVTCEGNESDNIGWTQVY